MISVIITSFNEAGIIGRAIEGILSNDFKQKYELIVAAPDTDTQKVVERYSKKHKHIKYFKDQGRGKANALNELFKIVKGDVLVLTDGDVVVGRHALKPLLDMFAEKIVGCVSGRPVATNPKRMMLGYFSHLLLDAGAHRIRAEQDRKEGFIECSGYLFAFRNGLVKEIVTDVAEDTVIPYLIWKQGYRIRYAPSARVYVKYPMNLRDFIRQRKRATAGSHAKLTKYYPDFPKVKTFWNEVRKGSLWALRYPRTFEELSWTFLLFFIRLYIWFSYYFEASVRKKEYGDAWERIESTK